MVRSRTAAKARTQTALECRRAIELKTEALELWRRTYCSERFFAHLYAGKAFQGWMEEAMWGLFMRERLADGLAHMRARRLRWCLQVRIFLVQVARAPPPPPPSPLLSP